MPPGRRPQVIALREHCLHVAGECRVVTHRQPTVEVQPDEIDPWIGDGAADRLGELRRGDIDAELSAPHPRQRHAQPESDGASLVGRDGRDGAWRLPQSWR